MSFSDKEQDKLIKESLERSFNNSAAINILVDFGMQKWSYLN